MENVIKNVSSAVSSAISSAAIVSALNRLIPAGGKEEKDPDETAVFIRNILIIIGVIVVVCGVVFAIVKFVVPRFKDDSDFEDEDAAGTCEEECTEDPDIADEFEKEN